MCDEERDDDDRSEASYYPDAGIAMHVEDLSLEDSDGFNWQVFIPYSVGGAAFGPPWFQRLKLRDELPCKLSGYADSLKDAKKAAEDALLAVGVPVVGRESP